jgi:DNA-binding NarL/FixJ family response regulator
MQGGYETEGMMPVLSSILNCPTSDRVASHILEPLCRHVGASSAVFVRYVRQLDRCYVEPGPAYGITPDSLRNYSESFFRADPLSPFHVENAARWVPKTAALDITDSKNFRRSFYYNEFLRPFGVAHVLGTFAPVRTFADEILCIGLHRHEDMAPFNSADTLRLEMLRPAVTAVLSNFALQSAFACADVALETVAQSPTPFGLVLLDERFSVIFANPKGVGDLGILNDVPGDRLHEVVRAITDRVKRGGKWPININIDTNSEGTRTATISQVTPRGAAPRYVVTTMETSLGVRMGARSQALDFSVRETEIARLVAAGLSNEAIGHQLTISFRTVENHLRAIYRKARVRSRTQLIARLLMMS